MPRFLHGMDITTEAVREAREGVVESTAESPLTFAMVKRVEFSRRFDFLFPELQEDADNLLPEAKKTRNNLVKLGEAMADQGNDEPDGDSKVSAAYTYFGQFVDHDISFEKSAQPGMKPPIEKDLKPMSVQEIKERTENLRTGVLELDSIYNLPAVREPEPDGPRMKVGEVSLVGGRPPNKDVENDLPRRGRSNDIALDRMALIGDPRNDENTIIAQLHVAFLHAHNSILEEMNPPARFRKAKRRLRRHFQYIVLHDFLKQIADPTIVDDVIENGNRVFTPADEDELFMPLEFAVAAYRFGHSMIRAQYDFNLNFNTSNPPGAPLAFLFHFTALSGQLGEELGLQEPDTDTLPENWIIEWENFFDPEGGIPRSRARRIDTQIVEPLQHLRSMKGEEEPGLAASLAVRNLLRGYQLRMPTGQAVARALQQRLQGIRDIPVLTGQQISKGAATDEQREVLQNSGFLERTPLWYYILAEAAFLRKGRRLGPVGSTIVAEVLVGLVRLSPDSILAPGLDWKPNLPSEEPGKFTLADLLRFARVL
jgi:hypothetical protein